MNKPFYQWSSQELLAYLKGMDRKTQIKFLIWVGGVGLFFVFIFFPAWIIRPQIDNQVEALRSQIQIVQGQIGQEPKLVEDKQKYETSLKRIRERLFNEDEMQRLLGLLAEMGQKSKVTLLSSKPDETAAKLPVPFDQSYAVSSYFISVEGGYHDLADFVSKIENYQKLLKVEEYLISPQEKTPKTHLCELKISAFLFKGSGGSGGK